MGKKRFKRYDVVTMNKWTKMGAIVGGAHING